PHGKSHGTGKRGGRNRSRAGESGKGAQRAEGRFVFATGGGPMKTPERRTTRLQGWLSPRNWTQYFVDLSPGFGNLMMHKLRSLLTMLGMIFGVAAVIAMLSIGAGARAQVMALIEQMGVRNVIVEAREANAWEDLQKVRKVSLGLSLRDFRVIRSNV